MHTTTPEQTATLPGRTADRVQLLIERFAAPTEPGKGPGGTRLAYSPLERRAASAQIVLAAEELANDSRHHGTRITVGKVDDHPGSITTIPGHCQLHIDVRDVTITASAASLGLEVRVMPSGASHDTQMINHVCPDGTIFVPSRNHGVSHSPDDFTDFEDRAVGIELLTASLVHLDASSPSTSDN